jgi:hypothetical protein
MEALPGIHPLHFPPHLMFIQRPSPVFPLFEALMRKVFFKVCDLRALHHRAGTNQANTASGYAITGARGVGKSHLMRLVNVLAPLLLPEVVSAYYSAAGAVRTSPLQLLSQACQCAGEDWASEQGGMEGLINYAVQHCRVLVLFVDGLPGIYKDGDFWKQLHTLAEDYYTALFVADSGSQLRALVKGDTWSDPGRIAQWHGVVWPSLNDKKLTIKELHPFTSMVQWQAYFKQRNGRAALPYHPPAVPAAIPLTTTFEPTDSFIRGIHIWTGGRLRELMRALSDPTEAAENAVDTAVPALGTVAYALVSALSRAQIDSGSFDPFDMAHMTHSEAIRVIEKWQQANKHASKAWEAHAAAAEVLVDLVDNHVLAWKSQGVAGAVAKEGGTRQINNVTFNSPLQHVFMSKLFPRVFISHASADAAQLQPLVTALQRMQASVVMCEISDNKQSMVALGLSAWRKRQVRPIVFWQCIPFVLAFCSYERRTAC